MALPVQFRWLDTYGRVKRQTLTTTATTIATALTDVAAFVPLFDAISDGGLQSVSVNTQNEDEAFAAAAGSNVDVNASLQVQGADGYKYDLNVPMIQAAMVIGGGAINISDAAMVAFTNQFLVGGAWRMNNRVPTAIISVIKGILDK